MDRPKDLPLGPPGEATRSAARAILGARRILGTEFGSRGPARIPEEPKGSGDPYRLGITRNLMENLLSRPFSPPGRYRRPSLVSTPSCLPRNRKRLAEEKGTSYLAV
ncbi:hypothetical protein KM043_007264 [Ampulex compressa]|nr:hypothetical protein KM043_007264 [Ampulex compressa]